MIPKVKELNLLVVKQAIPVVNEDYLFSPRQNYLYRKAMRGLKGMSMVQLARLSDEQKSEIETNARRVQKFLNLWKQAVCIKITNKIFLELFPNNKFTMELIENFSTPFTGYFNTLDFKILGITKSDIIKQLIENNYLPQNFYEL